MGDDRNQSMEDEERRQTHRQASTTQRGSNLGTARGTATWASSSTAAQSHSSILNGTFTSTQDQQPVASTDLLLRAVGLRPTPDPEAAGRALSKAHHLHLHSRGLTSLASLKPCPKLEVVYLYDNSLTDLSCLATNKLVTHLYVQNNQLPDLAGCRALPLLQKLYVQGNCLTEVSHLEGCSRLQELHVSQQRHLPTADLLAATLSTCSLHAQQQHLDVQSPADSNDPSSSSAVPALSFCPKSLHAIAGSLRVLGAAGCGIADPSVLAPLSQLQQLDLTHNSICEWGPLVALLRSLPLLQSLDLRGNPLAAAGPKYRDRVILAAGRHLQQLDGSAIPPAHRTFLMNAQAVRHQRAMAAAAAAAEASAAAGPRGPPSAAGQLRQAAAAAAAAAAGSKAGRGQGPPTGLKGAGGFKLTPHTKHLSSTRAGGCAVAAAMAAEPSYGSLAAAAAAVGPLAACSSGVFSGSLTVEGSSMSLGIGPHTGL